MKISFERREGTMGERGKGMTDKHICPAQIKEAADA
jgi:hypothetical protein